MIHFSRWLILLVVLFAANGAVAAEKRVALVVGNSAYEHTTPLRNPVNDAKDLAAVLQELGFDVTTAFDAKAQQLDAALRQFSQKIPGADAALFFYAGHGVQFAGRNYLIPVDARITDEISLKRETTAADDVMQMLETGGGVNLMFLDACRDNPLAEQLKRSITAPSRAAQIGRGLAPMQSSGGDTLITFSTAPGDVAADGVGRNSPFASALLRHIRTPGVDVEVMLKRVTDDVRKATNDRQKPERLSKLTKEFAFKPGEATPPPPPPKRDATFAYHDAIAKGTPEALRGFAEEFPDDPRVARIREIIAAKSDEEAWSRTAKADSLSAYRLYITTFPDGIHMESARRRVAALEEKELERERKKEREAAAVLPPSPQPGGPVAGGRSYWDHNGSLVYLIAEGNRRRFYYERPRAGMQEVGVQRGTLLFDGKAQVNGYSGTAYIFTTACGRLPYAVRGVVSNDQRRVVMRGSAPMQVDTACRVLQYKDDELIFEFASSE